MKWLQGTPPQPLQPPAPGTQPVPPVPVAAPGTPGGFPQGVATGKLPVATAQPTQAAPAPAPPKLPPAASTLATVWRVHDVIETADVAVALLTDLIHEYQAKSSSHQDGKSIAGVIIAVSDTECRAGAAATAAASAAAGAASAAVTASSSVGADSP